MKISSVLLISVAILFTAQLAVIVELKSIVDAVHVLDQRVEKLDEGNCIIKINPRGPREETFL